MAKILSMIYRKHSIDFILSGTLGDTVWVYRNGLNYKRSKPASVHNPRTQGQLEQRAKFALMVKFLQPLISFLRVGFESQATKMTPFNAAMSCNFKRAIAGTYPDYRVDYSKVQVSRGSLPGAVNPVVKITCAYEIEFSWDNNSYYLNARADDKVMLVVYNAEKQQALTTVVGNLRIIGSHCIALPSTFAGDEVHCYIAFGNALQTRVSDSGYVGGIRVAR